MRYKTLIHSIILFTSGSLALVSAESLASPDSSTGHDSHRHASWVQPPVEYQQQLNQKWTDLSSIKRGQTLYQQNCVSCHGQEGTGNGPVGKTLAHAPADLSNHFHNKPGDGDAYLFWRVSEGGAVEPFKSMQSAMPAFKNTLTEQQRWDVLSYIHTYFHLGLVQWDVTEQSPSSGSANRQDQSHDSHQHH